MRELKWSVDSKNNFNGKVGHLTLFVIAWHSGWNTYILIPKLPGLNKAYKVASVIAGKRQANRLYINYVGFLTGAKW